jgi:HEXXH motif-containing protein
MLAVHAFLPVARMHRAMLDLGREDADPQRYREVCQVNHEGMEVLRAAAKPTAVGAPILAGMDALEAALWAEAAAGA